MNKAKAAIIVSRTISIIQAIFGWMFAGFFSLGLIIEFTDDSPSDSFIIGMCITFILIGIMLLLFSRKRKKSIKLFKQYVAILSGDPSGSISNIASATKASNDLVKKNLQYMIKKNYFVNANLDEKNNCIILGTAKKAVVEQPVQHDISYIEQSAQKPTQQVKPQVQTIPVVCKCCGGMNQAPKGVVVECDFCGSPINA